MTRQSIPIQVAMDDEDFSRLCTNSTRWAAYVDDRGAHPGWRQQVCDGRFEGPGSPCALPSLHWGFAYWLGGGYTTVILARSFLDSRSVAYEVVFDTADPGEWVILTDYDYIWRETPVSPGG